MGTMTGARPGRPEDPLLAPAEGESALFLGNEAIVRGALEAGVRFASGYPGTPSSEVTDSFARIASERGIVFEYSVNEKVAVEMAFAASLAGARSIVAMKHLGLMYAGDPITTIPYIGTGAGMVIVSAGDPSCRTSPNEQDQRQLADMLHLPVLDPSTPQDALDMTRFAFELSEKSRLPVLLRPTTWVCHTRARVECGTLREGQVTGFQRDPSRLVPVPAIARGLRLELVKRVEVAREMLSSSGFFRSEGVGRLAVAACGAAAAIAYDVLREQGLQDRVRLLTLGAAWPLPEDWIVEQLRDTDALLVVEELSPCVEDALRALCKLQGLAVEIHGKRTGHLPVPFEYDASLVRNAIHAALGVGSPAPAIEAIADAPPPPRPPILCPGCPHRSAFFAAREVFGEDALYFNDIGCYTLGFGPPLESADALLCMGAGFTLAAGVSRVSGERTVGFMGDSTFFHSGMPALLNAVKEGVNMVAVIMDNEVTAMTGFQESPGIGIVNEHIQRRVSIEGVVRALGVEHVVTVDPADVRASTEAFRAARDGEGVHVVITERACPIFEARVLPEAADAEDGVTTFVIDQSLCRHCGLEESGHRCTVDVDKAYERAIAGARSREVGEEEARPPVAACTTRCPLHLCIQGYAGSIAARRYESALKQIMIRLPLPESVCRVCHRPCEDVCVRAEMDGAVAINDLKRFVVDWAAQQPEPVYQPQCEAEHGARAAIVGAGPAGLAAAHDLRLRGFDVTLYDARPEAGGLLRYGIPRYRLPRRMIRRDVARILETGVRFEAERRLGEDLDLEKMLTDFDAVLLALGASRSLLLDLPGEGPPVVDALTWLGPQDDLAETLRPRNVLVVGGGDAAVDSARVALRRGAAHVTLACLESRATMPALPSEVAEAEEEGIEIRTRVQATALRADGVALVEVEARTPDATHPDDFLPRAGTETELACDLVIAAIGQVVARDGFDSIADSLPWSAAGIAADPESGATGHPRLFAAGDLVPGGRTVTGAIAAGLRAAWAIDRGVRGPELADRRMPPPIVPDGPPELRHGVRRPESEARIEAPRLAPDLRRHAFDEVTGVFSEAQARAEASRCMICGLCGNCRACLDLFGCPAFFLEDGRITIDPDLCTACGVCAAFCPNNAIVPEALPAAAPVSGAAPNAGGTVGGAP